MNFYWDSIVWDTNEILVYKYDSKGNIIEQISKYFSEGVFVNSQRTVNQYNAKNKLTMAVSYFWDSLEWKPTYREKYSFIKGYKLSSVYEYFNDTSWVFMYGDSSAYVFNANNLPTSIISFSYNDFDQKWERSGRIDITYGTDNKPEQVIMFEWTGSKWQNSMKMTNLKWDLGFSFDESEPTSYIQQYFELGKWVNAEKYIAIVSDSLISTDSSYMYDTDLLKWIPQYYSKYTYNSKKQLLEKFKWQFDGLGWDTSEVVVYEYDSKGNEKYNMMGSKYMGGWFEIWSALKTFYTYGPDAQIREIWTEYYDSWAGEWIKGMKTKYYYASMVSVSDFHVKVKIYPNPVDNYLKIDVNEGNYLVLIFDLSGSIIENFHFNGSHYLLNTAFLKSGVYLLKIINSYGVSTTEKIYIR